MQDKELIFNTALEQLADGKTINEIVLAYPEFQGELKSFLQTAQTLYQLPKNQIPAPAMRRKYLLHPAPVLWISWLHFSRWAIVSMSAVLVLTAVAGTSYAALMSLPGQTLFKVKTSVEGLRLNLTTNPTAKAQLQVQFAEQRLQEVQQVLQNPSSDTQAKTAAVNELVATTNSTVNAVSVAAHASSGTSSNHPLLASLENITSQQKSLLTQVKNQSAVSQVANSALATTQQAATQVAQIKQYLQIASSEQTLSQAVSNPNAVTISGYVDQVNKTSILVEKTTFSINANTVIQDSMGNTVTADALNTTTKVSVVGTQDGKLLVAQQISVIGPVVTGTVQGASTTTPGSATSSPNTTATSTGQSSRKAPAASTADGGLGTSTQPSVTPDPNTATGSFILENP